jgi:hypothetical protein
MKQLKVSLPDSLRDAVEAAAERSGNSLGNEIRERLERTLNQDADPKTAKLLAAIQDFAVWTRLYTDHAWHKHPAASRALRRAITAHIARQWGKSIEDAVFKANELPTARLIDSDDPDTIGLSIEATQFHMPAVSEERLRQMNEAAMEKSASLDEETK